MRRLTNIEQLVEIERWAPASRSLTVALRWPYVLHLHFSRGYWDAGVSVNLRKRPGDPRFRRNR